MFVGFRSRIEKLVIRNADACLFYLYKAKGRNVLSVVLHVRSCRTTRTMYETHGGISMQQAGHSLSLYLSVRMNGRTEFRRGGENLPREDFSQAWPLARPFARLSARRPAAPARRVAHLLPCPPACADRSFAIHPVLFIRWDERADAERKDARSDGRTKLAAGKLCDTWWNCCNT